MGDNERLTQALADHHRTEREIGSGGRDTVYCGPVDEYFDQRLGPLPWRSLEFEFKRFDEAIRHLHQH